MTQGDKELLLKDLCARLPYDVKVRRYVYTTPVDSIQSVELFDPTWLEELYAEEAEFKPYLFPLSSMTEAQKIELEQIKKNEDAPYYHDINDFFLKYHLDNRHLIEKGLAIDTTGLNIY